MHMKKIFFLISFIIISFNFYGCGSKIFNPYEKEFSCPNTYNGKCTTLDHAYQESINKSYDDKDSNSLSNKAEKDYIDKKFNRLRQMVEQEKAPLIVPPTTKRALILPYETGSEMYSFRKIYFFVEEPKFQLPPLESLKEKR